MTTPDVPAERERDELLRELSHYWILDGDVMRCVGCNRSLHISRANELLRHRYDCAFADSPAPWATLAALLAPQEAPAEGISLSAQLSQAAAWMRVWDECQRLGMDTYGAPSTRTGLDIVLDFIRGHAAPQETREPELTFRELRRANVERRDELLRVKRPGFRPEHAWSLNDWLTALAGEVGEVANLLKKVKRGDFTLESVRHELAREIGDVQTYLDLLAYAAGIDLGDATAAKWNEVSERVGLPHRIGLGAPAPAEATEPSAPDGATWGDVRSGLRAELIAEGMPVTEATRLARKVVHRFTAAEATERSES